MTAVAKIASGRAIGPDALKPGERRIMALWDAGLAMDAIAARTGMGLRCVRNVVYLYDDRPDPDEAAALRKASAELAAATLRLARRLQVACG